jgi:hypothetical protein
MHITDSQLTLGSTHALETRSVATTTLQRIHDPAEARAFRRTFEQELDSLMAERLHDNAPLAATPCCGAPERLHDMLETMLAMLFGAPAGSAASALPVFATPRASAAPHDEAVRALTPQRAHWQITQSEQRSETESCGFSASGKVCLADGSERQFDVDFRFERSEETSTTVSRSLIDPLVLDCAAPGAGLGAASIEFDLDSDGTAEKMRLPEAGSGFLFLDRNHNGRADNGSELFGPASGNGFAELARLDSDRNGWIDSADAAFADLRLWQGTDADHQSVRSLAEAGVGALATAAAATPFALKEHGEKVGQMRSSSVWLGESGGAGVVRQIDVSTTPIADQRN